MTQVSTGRTRRVRAAFPTCSSGIGPGTGVLTANGSLPAEMLSLGDRVITHDAGFRPLAAVVRRQLPAQEVIRVRPSVLAPEAGERDFLISARQVLLLRDWRARAMFGRRAVLVSADKLIDGIYMRRLDGSAPVTLLQLRFDDTQHVLHLGDMHLMATSARMPVRARG